MAEVISNINPLGRGTGYDYVYNPQPVISALQYRVGVDQQRALREAADEYKRLKLQERAEQAALKSFDVKPSTAGYYDDLYQQDYADLQDALVSGYKGKTMSPVVANSLVNRYQQQGGVLRQASKEHDAYIQKLANDPIINKDVLLQVLHEKRILLSEQPYRSRKGVYVPPIAAIHKAVGEDARLYNPAAVGAEITQKMTGVESYQFQGPDAKGRTITRDKILDDKGNINTEVALDIVKSNPRYSHVYDVVFAKNLKDQQSQGIIGATPSPAIAKLVADQTLKQMFPNTLGNFTEKVDKTGFAPRTAKKDEAQVSTEPIVTKIDIIGRGGNVLGYSHKSNPIEFKKTQPLPKGLHVLNFNAGDKEGEYQLSSGEQYKTAVPTVVFRAKEDILTPDGKHISVRKGRLLDPNAVKGGKIDPNSYTVLYGYQVTPEIPQEVEYGRDGTRLVTPAIPGKTFFARKGTLPNSDVKLKKFLQDNKMTEADYFEGIRNEILGTTTRRSILFD